MLPLMSAQITVQVTWADEKKIILATEVNTQRFRYDENSWLDMVQQVRNEYSTWGNNEKICDVSHAIARMELLAKTPMEKVHTRMAASVARRIMETDTEFNPDYTATGHWNFFAKKVVTRQKGVMTINHDFRWSFEWKCMGGMG